MARLNKILHPIQSLADACPVESRPKCPGCGRPLKPFVGTVDVPYPYEVGPGPGRGTDPFSTRAREYTAALNVVDVFGAPRIEAWLGWYEGYSDTGPSVFCRKDCAVKFACAAHRAGYRLKGV